MTASSTLAAVGRGDGRWTWPLDAGEFDTTIALRGNERRAIAELGSVNLRRLQRQDASAPGWSAVRRLLRPLDAVNAALDSPPTSHRRRAMGDAVAVILLRCADLGRAYWGWTIQEWTEVIGPDQVAFRDRAPGWADDAVRPYLVPHAYLLAGFTEFHRLGSFSRLTLAWRVFGHDRVQDQISRLRAVLAGWGYRLGSDDDQLLPMVAAQVFLLARSPHLEELSTPLFDRIRDEQRLIGSRLNALHAMQRAVADLGFCDPPTLQTGRHSMRASGGAPAWEQWADRWHATSTLTARVRGSVRGQLLKVGRWAATDLPEAGDPQVWTRATCATWIAAVDRMSVGDHVQRTAGLRDRIGQPLAAGSKAAQIAALRTFFRDCQEWEWLPRRFDPQRALATPRSIAALVGPNPRMIADDIWAKLLWAGLNLAATDLPQTQAGPFYPLELVRAVTLTWLFSGQRSDEIARLRVGCIRWQTDAAGIDGVRTSAATEDGLAQDTLCLLDVPTHKTGTAFTKPVDPILGQALDAWATVRPTQPALRDRRTGEQVDLLRRLGDGVGPTQACGSPASGRSVAAHRPTLSSWPRTLPRTRAVNVDVACHRSAHCSQAGAPPLARIECRPVCSVVGSQNPRSATARCMACSAFRRLPISRCSSRIRSNSGVDSSSRCGLRASRNTCVATIGSSWSSSLPSR